MADQSTASSTAPHGQAHQMRSTSLQEFAQLPLKERVTMYLTVHFLILIMSFSFELSLASKLLHALPLLTLCYTESTIVVSGAKKLRDDCLKVISDGLIALNAYLMRFRQVERALEDLHDHIVNCETKLNVLCHGEMQIIDELEQVQERFNNMDATLDRLREKTELSTHVAGSANAGEHPGGGHGEVGGGSVGVGGGEGVSEGNCGGVNDVMPELDHASEAGKKTRTGVI